MRHTIPSHKISVVVGGDAVVVVVIGFVVEGADWCSKKILIHNLTCSYKKTHRGRRGRGGSEGFPDAFIHRGHCGRGGQEREVLQYTLQQWHCGSGWGGEVT